MALLEGLILGGLLGTAEVGTKVGLTVVGIIVGRHEGLNVGFEVMQ